MKANKKKAQLWYQIHIIYFQNFTCIFKNNFCNSLQSMYHLSIKSQLQSVIVPKGCK